MERQQSPPVFSLMVLAASMSGLCREYRKPRVMQGGSVQSFRLFLLKAIVSNSLDLVDSWRSYN